MNKKNTGVRTLHPDYERYLPKWNRCADTVAGQDAIHTGGTNYLAKLKDEAPDDYKARLSRSDFFNATWRTISGLSGMAFRKPPQVEVPKAVEPFLADINMAGVSLDDMARELTEAVLEYGRMGLLVDHPPAPDNVVGMTVADSEKLGLRPTIQVYEAKHIINWKFGRVRNTWVLTMVVLQEAAAVGGDEYGHETEARYRVLDLDAGGAYRQRVFRINDKGEDEQVGADVFPLMNGKPLGYIPFAFVGAGGKADAIDEPPMIDLVDTNIAHYQVNSDYRHGLHFTGLPTPCVSGFNPDPASGKLYIGSQSAWTFPDPNAKAYYLEFTGQGLASLETALKGIELRMALLGARAIADESRQAETLGGTQIKRAGENGVLATIVGSVSGALEWALGIFAQWAGATGAVSFAINRDFMPPGMDAQELTALVGAWQAGAISEAELFSQLQRGDVIDSSKTLDEHQEEVSATQPPMPRPALPAAEAA